MENRITIVGLGPGDYKYLTVEADKTLQRAGCLYARTLKHPVVEGLIEDGRVVHSYDALYENAEDFEGLYKEIADDIWRASQTEPVVYAVPGNPLISERTVELLVERAEAEKATYRIVQGFSCVDAVLKALRINPIEGYVVLDATALESHSGCAHMHLVVFQIDNRLAAAQVKLRLMKIYPDTHPVMVVKSAGIEGAESIRRMGLYEVDQEDWFDHMTTLYIPPLPPGEIQGSLDELVGIMALLRSPEGCPWDLKQNHKTLLPYLIEEAYEVLDAVEQEDMGLLEEELGDLLLQVVFHARIAEENGEFEVRDVIRGICEKMIRRHPHVFADTIADTSEAVLVNWEAIKKEEKAELGQHTSMNRIPRQLPALMRSYKVQQKAAEVGFDWDSIQGALDKVQEEYQELVELLGSDDHLRIEEEVGDLLFAAVNVARFLKVSPEQALNRTTEKFIKRYKYVEDKSTLNGINMKKCGIEILDGFWNEAKTFEKQQKQQKRT